MVGAVFKARFARLEKICDGCKSHYSFYIVILLLGQAITKHLQLMEQCKNNQGCDRHLLGLKIQALEQGQVLPELFRDPVYQLSGGDGNFVMSTSLCGYSEVTGACPPMTYDGYGVFYGIPNDKYVKYGVSLECPNYPKSTQSRPRPRPT